jgi:hypothetical protein
LEICQDSFSGRSPQHLGRAKAADQSPCGYCSLLVDRHRTDPGELGVFVVQDPFKIGYLAVKTMVEHIQGLAVPKRIDTGSTLVTMENLSEPDIHRLLHPEPTRASK